MAWEKAPQPQPDGSGRWAKFPKEGDSVEGEIVDLDLESGAQTYEGTPCGYVQLKPDAGEEIRLGLDKKMIADQVVACEPKVGDRLRVDFTGWRNSERTGRQYKFYEVFIDRALADPNSQPTAQQAPPAGGESPPPTDDEDDLPF